MSLIPSAVCSSSILSSFANEIHEHACEVATRYKRAESELIDILQIVDQKRIYIETGHSSLFQYVVHALKLSESVAYNLITVARKAREIPELKESIRSGAVTLSNARKIVPLLTVENKKEWIERAENLSQRILEKELVRYRPMLATCEKATYVTPERVKLEVGLSESEILRLRQVQDLLSQSKRRPVSLEEVIQEMTAEFLKRHDPVQKAQRQKVKKGLIGPHSIKPTASLRKPVSIQAKRQATPKKYRTPIPASILHAVHLRDQRKCAHVNMKGERCDQTRFLEIHHRLPIKAGGDDSFENLITLCSAHHRYLHNMKQVNKNSINTIR